MTKRYIFFLGALCDGGAERVVSILSGCMAEAGMPVEILCYYDREVFYEIDPKVKLTAVEQETHSTNKIKNLLWLRTYLKQNAKAVISFLAPFNMMALMASMGLKTPIIVADRNDPRKIPGQPVLRKFRDVLYRFADGVVVQTTHNLEYFSKAVQKRAVIIYNPIDLKEKAGLALRSEKRPEIVSVGRLMPQKNQKMLIEAFSEIHKKFPEYTLTIYGEGPSRMELEAQIAELTLQNAVYLPGSVKDLHERIASAELFVMSSDYEGMSNALIEAMCLGLPVVSTKVSGATDLVEDGVNGLLVEIGDKDGMVAALEKLLDAPEILKRYAGQAVKLNDALNINDIMQRWIAFINSIA